MDASRCFPKTFPLALSSPGAAVAFPEREGKPV